HVWLRHSGAMRSIELWCAIAHQRISRFRVWSFEPSRNDGANQRASLGGGPTMTEKLALSVNLQQTLDIAGVTLLADLSGALLWEDEPLRVVPDLHLEKGSSSAARGVLLPPYDTAATLSQLAAVISRHDPHTVIALGDSFHDRNAHERLSQTDRDAIGA